MDFNELVFNRRTAKDFDGTPVAKEKLVQLLEWAVRAPNHHLNQPWRFIVLEKPGVDRLVGVIRESLDANEQKLAAKMLSRLQKVGAIIFVGVLGDLSTSIAEENFSATCAAVQNILLGATSLEMGSYWSSNRYMTCQATKDFIGWQDSNLRFIAAIWLGKTINVPDLSPRKSIHEVSRFV